MKRLTSAQIRSRFGNPADSKGHLNRAWEHANVVSVLLPFPMRNVYNEQVQRAILFHRKGADQLIAAQTDIWNYTRRAIKARVGNGKTTVEYDRLTLDELQRLGLDLYGGSYVFRLIRGANSLSMHAYAIAFDVDPKHNALGTKGRFFKPEYAPYVAIYERHGFYWGGRFSRKDGMHFELTAA